MQLSSFKTLCSLLVTVTFLSSCGGHGTSAPPPVGGLNVTPLEGGVQVEWTAVPGVEYWLYYKTGTNICKNCGDQNPDNWKNGGTVLGLRNALISSPYYLPNLPNGTAYAFMMDARINGGPAGEATASITKTPTLAGITWASGGQMGSGNIKSIVHNNGAYIGLGSGTKYQSSNGSAWSQLNSTNTTNFRSATYAFSKYVGVGESGAVIYTSDLLTWTPATLSAAVSSHLNAVASNGSLLVAVGDSGSILTSGDGVNWTTVSPAPTTNHLYAIAYSSVGLWVAVGEKGLVLTSTDGLTWSTARAGSNTDPDLKGVAALVNTSPSTAYSIVAIASDGTVLQSSTGMQSTVGTVWSAFTPITTGTTTRLNAIVASSGQTPANQFIVVGDGGKAFTGSLTSANGVSWTPQSTNTTQNLMGLIRGYHNQYLAWAADGSTVTSK